MPRKPIDPTLSATPPVASEQSKRPPVWPAQHRADMSQWKAIVLVVEDDPLIRMCAVDLISDAGFETLEAGSADEAIRILESRHDVHLVFTDVEMPGTMDGVKLAHYIRNRWPPVKLIVASGRTIIDEAHLPEGTRFFAKPYMDRAILNTLVSMLGDPGNGVPTLERS